MAAGGGAGTSVELLGAEAGGRAASVEVAVRSATPVDQDLSRRQSGSESLGGTDRSTESAQPEPGGDAVYDAAGGLRGVAGALQRAGGFAGRISDRRSDTEGDRGPDRILRQHPGHEGRS